LSRSSFGDAVHLEAEGDVLTHSHVGVERVGLEHHGDVPLGRVDAVDDAILDLDLAAGDALEPRDHVQKRGLAAARGADEDEELALLHGDIDPVQHLDGAVGLGDVVDVEKTHGSGSYRFFERRNAHANFRTKSFIPSRSPP
jgi:hypothetical protein